MCKSEQYLKDYERLNDEEELTMSELHCHTDYSNPRVIDAISTVEELIQTAADLGKKAVALTEHENVSSHMKGIQTLRKLKEEGKIPQDFKLILGNEIYLCNSLEEVKDNYQSGVTKFPHFLLLAKNAEGHEALRYLSSAAWENSFYTSIMERVPTMKDKLAEIVNEYPNTLIASSACLGSEASIHILNDETEKAKEFLQWCSELFGKDNFFLELQPSDSTEQQKVNEWLIKFSKELNLELILTSDVHYLRPEDASIHEAFLNSKDAEREVASFYESCYIHKNEEIFNKLSYLDPEIVVTAMRNTIKISDSIEEYTLEAPTVIPKIELPKFEDRHLFSQGYDQYKYIKLMAYSENDQDRYLVHQIEQGFLDMLFSPNLSKDKFHKILARINVELGELWEISIELHQSMGSYYVTVQELVNIMWGDDCGEDSRTVGGIVGSGRGSASGFLINYLLGITTINPLSYGVEMPHWRHLHKSRGDIGALDVDLDYPPHLRPALFKRMKEKWGDDRVVQVATFGTEKSKSAVQTACRGLGYEKEVGQYISSLIPFTRGENYTISECLYGDEEKERKPVKEFINEINKYPRLAEVAQRIEGLINKRSIHAGGMILTNESYIKKGNAMMRAPNGTPITQFNLDDSQAAGVIKYDLLGVSNMSKLQLSLEMMLKEGLIEWQGTLRKTFNKYFHPDNMDLNKPDYYKLLGEGQIPDLFQFDTALAIQALVTAKPSNLVEMAAVNSLMRLLGDGNETPVETFTRYKNNIQLWYDEMDRYGLNEEEIKVMEEYLYKVSGVGETQEVAMLLSMDERIAGFDVRTANKLRKAIAKKSDSAYEKARKDFYAGGEANGNRKNILDYVWQVQIQRQRNYSFSILHTIAYSIIGLQNISVVADFSPIVWYTACLTVNSGSLEVEEGDKKKSTDYGKVASALGDLRSYGIRTELPLINSASFSFSPDIVNNRIIFSLKGINGIGDDIVHSIIANRPFSSFDDFHTRMYLEKKIQRGQVLQLIKAGCFNEFGSQVDIMKQFIVKEVVVRTELDGKNLPKVISLGLLDTKEYKKYQDYFYFRVHIKKVVYEVRTKPKNKILALNDAEGIEFFEKNFTDASLEGYTENGGFLIDEKLFEKEYKELMKPAMKLLSDEEFIRKFNMAQFLELWGQLALGTVESWQMNAVSFYADKHELEDVDYEKYGISNYFDLPEVPVVESTYQWHGRDINNYRLHSLIGTVVDKNANNHTISFLTKEGVVNVKQWKGSFSHYDRQIKIGGKIAEKSWFTKNTLLIIRGYRVDDQFILKAEKGKHTVNKITEVREDNTLGIQTDRVRE